MRNAVPEEHVAELRKDRPGSMNTFFQHLGDPEYMHVLINPMPVYGLSIAVIGLALALIFRSRRAVLVALALIVLSGLSAWPTYSYGEAAYDRIKAMSDSAGEQWLDEHMARGERLIYAFYLLAALAAAGMILPIKWPRSAVPLGVATLVMGGATLGIGGYISYAGGHVRHKEFRFEPPPAPKMAEHHHGGEEQAAHQHGAQEQQSATEQGTAPTTQKPMEHAEHEEMQSPAQQPMEHAQHEQMQSPGEKPMTEEEKKQLEASRLQLEASQKQLEASRKQLEAVSGQSPSASPSGSPSAKPSASEHKHDDEHPH